MEQSAKDSEQARDIVSEILSFGVTQQQILRVTYLLSLELEDREAMVDISTCIKTYVDHLGNTPKKSVIET
jgi:hypothetical protein